jgi:hypothetical protein
MKISNIDQKIIQQMVESITGYLKWQNNTVGIIYNIVEANFLDI